LTLARAFRRARNRLKEERPTVTADPLSAQAETHAWEAWPEFLKSGEASYPVTGMGLVNNIIILEAIITSAAHDGDVVELRS
jgi:hypothetical protein